MVFSSCLDSCFAVSHGFHYLLLNSLFATTSRHKINIIHGDCELKRVGPYDAARKSEITEGKAKQDEGKNREKTPGLSWEFEAFVCVVS